MPSPFQRNISLKVEGEDISMESFLVHMWHLLVAYISIGSILPQFYVGGNEALWCPILLLAGAK
jgi:hypothetical protein